MTREQLQARYPNASESFLRRNSTSMHDLAKYITGNPEPEPAKKKCIRQRSNNGPNKWEQEFANGLISEGYMVKFEGIKLRLANGVFYSPDLLAYAGNSITIYEVKGFMRDDAAVKAKVAAAQFPCFRFVLAWKEKGIWREQAILP